MSSLSLDGISGNRGREIEGGGERGALYINATLSLSEWFLHTDGQRV